MNPFDAALFAVGAPCLPCCTTPGVCACALLIPPFSSPFPDYASALSVVSDPLEVADCILFYQGSGNVSSLSAIFNGTSVAISESFTSPVSSTGDNWLSLTASTGDVFSLAFTGGVSCSATLYDCFGTEIEHSVGTTTRVFTALAADGTYYLKASTFNPPGPGSPFSSATFTVTCSGVFVPNPVIALWDDSGTTRQLEACPKLYLPILTESTGDWYADCAAAAAVLADPTQVSNCVGFLGTATPTSSFTATGGSSLAWSVTDTSPPGASNFWGSFNGVKGDVINTTWTDTLIFGPGGGYFLYDDTGTLIDSFLSHSGSGTSIALPYTGRYTIEVVAVGDPSTLTLSGTAGSSGVMTTNDIQALYDTGLTCPSRLNCGDSC